MLNSSLKTVGVTNVNVVAILNDTTGTLVAGSHDFPNTAVGKLGKTVHIMVHQSDCRADSWHWHQCLLHREGRQGDQVGGRGQGDTPGPGHHRPRDGGIW